MSTTIPQRELRNDNARIMDAVAAGESFIITRNGHPVAELRPVADHRRALVPRAAVRALAQAGPEIDAAAFRDDLDHHLDSRLA